MEWLVYLGVRIYLHASVCVCILEFYSCSRLVRALHWRRRRRRRQRCRAVDMAGLDDLGPHLVEVDAVIDTAEEEEEEEEYK